MVKLYNIINPLPMHQGNKKGGMSMKKKRLFSLLTAAALSLSLAAPVFAAEASQPDALSAYSDLAEGAWYLDAVRYAVENGLMIGTDKGLFQPEADVTRAVVYQTLYSKEGKPATDPASAFPDAAGKWYADSAAWAKSTGLSAGDGSGKFAGDRIITYGEMDIILKAYAEYKGLSTKGLEKSSEDSAATAVRADLAAMLQKIAGLKKYYYDPADPYNGVMDGMFEVPVTLGEETHNAVYYLAEGLEPWTPGTIILTPDNTTAAAFAESETGLAWRAFADKEKIALAFFAPANGGKWNLSMSENGRDDGAFLHELFAVMRSKKEANAAAFWLDKTTTNVIGYGAGGAAALLFGAEYATDFSAICAVDATAIPAGSLDKVGEQLVYPFPGDSSMGLEEMQIKAKTVDMPVWFINSAKNNAQAVDYFIAANDAKQVESGKYQAAESDAYVLVTDKAETPEAIYTKFLGTIQRFMAMQEGGRVSFVQDYDAPGFVRYEEEVNGELRRWLTYVPSSYTGEKEVPLVVVLHGYTGSNYGLAEESRWYDVAEENGFIVMFPQAFVRPGVMGNIPSSIWISGPFKGMFPNQTSVDIDFINAILDKTEAEYNIDASRIYATGHSNGSMLAFNLGETSTSRFAAICPIGYIVTPSSGFATDDLLPMWMMAGEFDSNASPLLEEGKTNANTLSGWNEHNGVDETTAADSLTHDDRWKTKTFFNEEGVPLTKFTCVLGTPHAYLQEQSVAVWEFFSQFSRGEDGTLYYNGTAVEANKYVADDGWYIPVG